MYTRIYVHINQEYTRNFDTLCMFLNICTEQILLYIYALPVTDGDAHVEPHAATCCNTCCDTHCNTHCNTLQHT